MKESHARADSVSDVTQSTLPEGNATPSFRTLCNHAHRESSCEYSRSKFLVSDGLACQSAGHLAKLYISPNVSLSNYTEGCIFEKV